MGQTEQSRTLGETGFPQSITKQILPMNIYCIKLKKMGFDLQIKCFSVKLLRIKVFQKGSGKHLNAKDVELCWLWKVLFPMNKPDVCHDLTNLQTRYRK